MIQSMKKYSLTRLRRGRYSIARRLGHYPELYFPLVRRFYYGVKGNRAEIVEPDTDIVIDGFTGSGNTFAFAAFSVAQTQPVKIAHHIHAPAQVTAALRYNVPVLIVIRQPEQAVTSILSRIRSITTRQVLNAYIRYHESLLICQEQLVIADFEDVTGNFGEVIRRVNETYGTRFVPFEHTQRNLKLSEARIKTWYASGREVNVEDLADRDRVLPLPSRERHRRREHFQEEYRAPELADLRRRAEQVYRTLSPRLSSPDGIEASGGRE